MGRATAAIKISILRVEVLETISQREWLLPKNFQVSVRKQEKNRTIHLSFIDNEQKQEGHFRKSWPDLDHRVPL
jgi:hypothetical protein